MLTSVKWLNEYLEPADLSADEAVRVLEATSFPIESRDDRSDGDAILDVEVTSNRGDCLCHLGLAREVAAATGRALRVPRGEAKGSQTATSSVTSVENRVTDVCPRFTARVIRGVKVGPSPGWLVDALASIGQRSINNIVDVSNYVLHEAGHPSHAFDLGTLEGRRLVVRYANEGEPLTVLDGKKHTLRSGDLVVADAARAVSLAGVIGGLETGVTAKTTDVLLEVATWHPLTIRATARRLGITTDAGYRFERYVDARTLGDASARAAALILELAGGELCDGVIDEGGDLSDPTVVELRGARCEHLLGKWIDVEEMERLLGAIGFGVEVRGRGVEAVLRCEIAPWRPDVTREVDLIEEVARLHGMDSFAVADRLEVPLEIDHPKEWEAREQVERTIGEVLTGAGFYETVTFSFAGEREGAMFTRRGTRMIKIDEERRRESPFLRPSVVPSLLTCRRANQDGNVAVAGGVRLYEISSVFAEEDDGDRHGRHTREHRSLALLMDAGSKLDEQQAALRTMRGAIEAVVGRVGGRDRRVDVRTMDPIMAAQEGGTFAEIVVDGGVKLGWMGVPTKKAIAGWDLAQQVVVAELEMPRLLGLWPALDAVELLPAFPAIERDLSVVVDDGVAWGRIEATLAALGLEMLEAVEFVGVFRGKQVGPGKKSATLRLRFRSPDRTLRHEEVDGQVASAIGALERSIGASLRA